MKRKRRIRIFIRAWRRDDDTDFEWEEMGIRSIRKEIEMLKTGESYIGKLAPKYRERYRTRRSRLKYFLTKLAIGFGRLDTDFMFTIRVVRGPTKAELKEIMEKIEAEMEKHKAKKKKV